MSTPTEEIAIDIDAADAKAAEAAAKSGKNGAATDSNAATDGIAVEKVDTQAKTADKQVVTPDEGLEKLKKQLEDERAGRLAAEQRANDASRAEAAARGEVQTSQLDLVKGAIERLTESSDVLEGQYADALAAQDHKSAAKIQRQMSDNSAKLIQLEAGKKALESAPKPTPRAPVDPVEAYVDSIGAQFPRSKDWVRAHPEFARDKHKNDQMIAAHQLAMARGLKPDTDEYFASVEKTLDLTPAVAKVDLGADASAEAAQVAGGRTAAPAAAPVSRSSNGANGNRPNVVKLTSQEVEIASMMGMSVEDYARNKMALKKEGKLS